ncbi:MAG: cellulase family glycosylhydrolase [Actinomycetota bacterium]|nr:cellulase family glycosylhydrolase [Actinomycetota bacterium]
MRRGLLATSGILLALLLAGCSAPTEVAVPLPLSSNTPLPSATFADGFVTVQGADFELGGRPFRFVGANIYDAAASSRYSCRSGSAMSSAQLLSTLRYLHDEAGVTVLRFWAYQTYTQAASYWGGMDGVIAAARSVGMKVIPVLEDGPGDCTNLSPPTSKASYRGDTWYSAGYKVPYGNASMSYRDYVAKIVSHYADDPTILGWSMMNEADTSARTSHDVSVLVGFATDIAGVIRSADSRHLITVGTQGNGAPGSSGPDFTAVYELPQISFSEVHDWEYWGSDTEPMPGGIGSTPPSAASVDCARLDAPIGCSFARAAELHKPLVVGEAGMRGVTAQERTTRASRMRAKMDAAFRAGASGYLVWSVTRANTDGYDVRIDTHDPLIAQLRQVATLVR